MNGKCKVNRLEERGVQFEERMFEKRSRYLMLFLTLNYKPEYRDDITLDDIRRHRDRLLKNTEYNSLLKGIEGYIWKIEEGREAGLHIHMLIFYSGASRADVHIAQSIGEYWESVATRGLGAYWNSNGDKDSLRRRGLGLGVGQVNRKDDSKRLAIHGIIRYLAKSAQAVTERAPHVRTFGISELP